MTLLLTDVEGSTRMWDADAELAAVVMARHHALLDAAIGLHGGVKPVEQGEGDSMVAAFARPTDALHAALDAQRALGEEAWPGGSTLRVRMALHSGEISRRDEGNYEGPTIIRSGRWGTRSRRPDADLGRDTRPDRDQLPEGVSLRDLGTHGSRTSAALSTSGRCPTETSRTTSRRCCRSMCCPTTCPSS